jgi:hypothetical protein
VNFPPKKKRFLQRNEQKQNERSIYPCFVLVYGGRDRLTIWGAKLRIFFSRGEGQNLKINSRGAKFKNKF